MTQPRLVLAGDVGGTKTNLGLYAVTAGTGPRLLRAESFASAQYPTFDGVLDAWPVDEGPLAAAAFGAAGPVVDGAVRTTNLPWLLDAAALARRLGCPVQLLNDLEATAWATLALAPEDCVTLNPGREDGGNRVVLAAGTGLGQALLVRTGDGYRVVATEGGHADFAPRNATEIALLEFLLGRFPRVSWERVLSGPGLGNVFDFVVARLGMEPDPEVAARLCGGDAGAVIGAAAVAGRCPASLRAAELFVELYGAQAGNLALTAMATGGVFVAGGIAPKLLPLLQAGRFVDAFVAKPPFTEMLQRIPVRVLTDANAPRTGAARVAASLASA